MSMRTASGAVWHDLECGAYRADLPLWRALAARHPGPVLEIGAGTGRVALDLAARGHEVLALDHDPDLLDELDRRARRLPDHAGRAIRIIPVIADGRDFELELELGLVLVPMQTVQLLGGASGRAGLFNCAARHLQPGGRLAIALTEKFDLYDSSLDDRSTLPPPEVREVSGTVYRSQATAVRLEGPRVVLERRREILHPDRSRHVESDRVVLDRVSPARLETEAKRAGLHPLVREEIPPTQDHVGSVVVILGA